VTEALLSAALRYAGRGWAVFPLNGKKPFHGTRGFHEATTDNKQIRKWWRKWPDANIGIACSSEHGPIVIDIDTPKKGEVSGLKLLSKLQLPQTREASTGSKEKRHLYFDTTLDNTAIKRRIRLKHNGKKYALDVLGNGGYVVAPPSIHPETGRKYRWENKNPLLRFPQQLIDILEETEKLQSAPPLPDRIDEGERDNLLTSLAGTMRRRGASELAILAALREENETRVSPPLPDKDLRRIAKSIASKQPVVEHEHYTDLGNARRFISQHDGTVRAVMAYRRPWLLWDKVRWTPDTTGEIERLAKQTVRRIYLEANAAKDEEARDKIVVHASRSEGAQRIRAMLELAATEQELCTRPEELDANPWFFNVNNGTIDLKTGNLTRHRRDDLITKLSPIDYIPDARAPRWERFLKQVTQGDEELALFLQRAVGYSLTGDTREQCLFFCYGQGSNGKSTFFETLRRVFGEYARQSDFSTFLASRGEGPRNDLARMQGARLITASEADSERGFDTRVIKLLTGDDTILARKLYEEHQEFKPQHKLWLAANHKPVVKEQTEGFWRRMRLVPFSAIFTEEQRDKMLSARLAKELPGILAWAVRGCQDWLENGLQEPSAIRKATLAYREENDILGEFLAAMCVVEPKGWTSTSALYQAFTNWWNDTRSGSQRPVTMGWFTRLLAERPEFKAHKRSNIRGWRGISLQVSI